MGRHSHCELKSNQIAHRCKGGWCERTHGHRWVARSEPIPFKNKHHSCIRVFRRMTRAAQKQKLSGFMDNEPCLGAGRECVLPWLRHCCYYYYYYYYYDYYQAMQAMQSRNKKAASCDWRRLVRGQTRNRLEPWGGFLISLLCPLKSPSHTVCRHKI